MHGLPTWEHRDPAEFRAAARQDITDHYNTVTFQDTKIIKVEKLSREDESSLFKAIDENGKEWWGRKLVLATGVTDIMLDIEGYKENWGTSIFHCLFCHGYEERGAASAGVLGIDLMASAPLAMHVSRYANRLADKVTIYTNGDEAVTKGIQDALSSLNPTSKTARKTIVESRKIAKFVKGTQKADVEVVFEDGSKNVEGFIAHSPKFKLRGGWVEQLGLATEQGNIKVNPPFNETSISGVFAGGDAGTFFKAFTPALSMGGFIAAGVAAQLEAED